MISKNNQCKIWRKKKVKYENKVKTKSAIYQKRTILNKEKFQISTSWILKI